jgi:hypothetical protein
MLEKTNVRMMMRRRGFRTFRPDDGVQQDDGQVVRGRRGHGVFVPDLEVRGEVA